MGISSENKEKGYLDAMVKDAPDVLYQLSQIKFTSADEPAEILTELPAAVNVDIILGMVNRWREVQVQMNRPLRVYAWSGERCVEKYVMGCVQRFPDICLTPLPIRLRRKKYVN